MVSSLFLPSALTAAVAGFFGCDLTHVNAQSRNSAAMPSRTGGANMFSWIMGGLLMAAGAVDAEREMRC
jgi:hypothetical protein